MQFPSPVYQMKYILEHGPEQQHPQEYIRHSTYAHENSLFLPKMSHFPPKLIDLPLLPA